MKKLISILVFLFSFVFSYGQYAITQNLGSSATLVNVPANGALQGVLIMRTFADTTAANATNADYYTGALIYTTGNNTVWVRNASLTSWNRIANGNIYTIDGTLTGNRALSGASTYSLNFNNLTTFFAGGTSDAELNFAGVTTIRGGTEFRVEPKTDIAGALHFSAYITPSQITSNQNDYSPTGLSTASILRLSSDASRNITGLTPAGDDGRFLIVYNVGSNDIVLVNESALSTASARFSLNADVTLKSNQTVTLHYDATALRWRSTGAVGGGGTVSGTTLRFGQLGEDTRGTSARSFSSVSTNFIWDSLANQDFYSRNGRFRRQIKNASGSVIVNSTFDVGGTSGAYTMDLNNTATGGTTTIEADPTTWNLSVTPGENIQYIHNSQEVGYADQWIYNQGIATSGQPNIFAQHQSNIGYGTDRRGFNNFEFGIVNRTYSRVYLDSATNIHLGTKSHSGNTYKGLRVDLSHQVWVDSMATGGSVDDSIVVITSGGQLKKRNGGATPTLQQVLTAGSTLTQDNTIVNGANTLTITGSDPSGTTFIATNTQGHAILGTASTSGAGIIGVSSSGYGGDFQSSSGSALSAISTTGRAAILSIFPATTNTVAEVLTLSRVSSGTAADGIGGFLGFYTEDDAGNANISNQLISKWTTAATATRTSEFSVTGVNSATTRTLMTLGGAGLMTLGVAGTNKGSIGLAGNTSGIVTIQPAAAAGTYTLTLPTDDGAADQVLKTDGSGVLSWTAAGSGNVTKVGTPANSQIGVWTGDGTIEGTAAFTYNAGAIYRALIVANSGAGGVVYKGSGSGGTEWVILNTTSGTGPAAGGLAVYDDAGAAYRFMISSAGNTNVSKNLIVGDPNLTTTPAASATGAIHLINATVPSGSVTNGILLYSEDVAASAELKARDEAGNIATLTPHNFTGIPGGRSEEMAWSFYSERDGQYVNVDMLKLARLVEELTGEKLVYIGKTNEKPNPKNK